MASGVYKRKPFTPEHCAAISKGLKNSDVVKAKAEAQRGIPLSSETCAAISKGHKDVPTSPEACAAISAAKKGVPQSPEHATAASKGREESGMYEVQRGGYDLVNHHYIYDESDLSLNTVQMTRSDHASLHHLLKKLGYIVPHINIKEI